MTQYQMSTALGTGTPRISKQTTTAREELGPGSTTIEMTRSGGSNTRLAEREWDDIHDCTFNKNIDI